MFSLRIKLFLAMLLASILLTISLLGSMQWSFTRGFGAYLREQQQLRLASIAEELAEHYATTGNWEGIDPMRLRLKHPRGKPAPDPDEGDAHRRARGPSRIRAN